MNAMRTARPASVGARGACLALVLGAVVLALGSAGCGGRPPAPDAGVGAPPRIRAIRFDGNAQVSAGALRDVMHLRPHAWWRPFQENYFYGTDHLERDLERVLAHYHNQGFVLARIDEAYVRYIDPEWVDLEIELTEGRRVFVREVALEVSGARLREKLRSQLRLRVGAPLLEVRLREDEERLQEAAEEAGYAAAQVTREMRFAGDSATVVYWVDRGPLVRVGDVHITGVQRTHPSVVRREIRFDRGDVFRRARAAAFQDRLFELGLFRTVRLRPDYERFARVGRAAREVTVDLAVAVAEKPAGWYGFGFGLSSSDQLRLLGEWGYRNVMGRARAVQVSGQIGFWLEAASGIEAGDLAEHEVELSYTEPWVFSPVWGQLQLYSRYHQEATFDERIYGLVVSARRDLSRFERLLASFENKWVATTDSTSARSDFQTRFLSLSLAADRRDFALDPHRGSFAQVRTEYAGGFLGGAASFVRLLATGSVYVPLGSELTWAARARAGWIRPIGRGVAAEGQPRELLRVPFDERFRAGGGTTVRGYDERSLGPYSTEGQPLGGLATLLLNTEVRFPLVWQIGGAVFLDAGNVWETFEQLTWSRWSRPWSAEEYSELDVAFSFGTGLRLATPVGPLRLDYGIKLGRSRPPGTPRHEWHLSLGQAF